METLIDLNAPENLTMVQDICNRQSNLYFISRVTPGLAYLLEAYSSAVVCEDKLMTVLEMTAILAVELQESDITVVEGMLDIVHLVFYYYPVRIYEGVKHYPMMMFPVLQTVLRTLGFYYDI
jgi:hypothetical protein